MIKKYLSFFAFYIPLLIHAQVTINVQLPSSGMIQKDQLWNMVLSNSGTSTIEGSIMLNLQDAATGQSVLMANTRNIFLSKGVKALNLADVQPVQYNNTTSGINGNYLPLGNYVACYTLVRGTNERVESLGEECIRIAINPLSPPLLNSPLDKSVLQSNVPQFSWTPPAPVNMFDDLSYDISVAEVLDGQMPADALLYNVPLYVKSHSKSTFENYPSSYSKLEEGKTYAWQVTARNGQSYSVPTEVWTFSIRSDSAKISPASNIYILLHSEGGQAGINYVSGDSLKLKYYSFDKEHETTIRFMDEEGKKIKEQKQKVIYGDNLFQFKLTNQFKPGKLYFIEIIDLQKKKYSSSFSIK